METRIPETAFLLIQTWKAETQLIGTGYLVNFKEPKELSATQWLRMLNNQFSDASHVFALIEETNEKTFIVTSYENIADDQKQFIKESLEKKFNKENPTLEFK